MKKKTKMRRRGGEEGKGRASSGLETRSRLNSSKPPPTPRDPLMLISSKSIDGLQGKTGKEKLTMLQKVLTSNKEQSKTVS
jgi:hypothetical protein